MKALVLAFTLAGIVSVVGPPVPVDAVCLAGGGQGSTYMEVRKDGGSWLWWEEAPGTCSPPVKILCAQPDAGTTRWVRSGEKWVVVP